MKPNIAYILVLSTYALSNIFFGTKEKEAHHKISLLFWQCNKELLRCPTEQTFSGRVKEELGNQWFCRLYIFCGGKLIGKHFFLQVKKFKNYKSWDLPSPALHCGKDNGESQYKINQILMVR